MAKTKQLLNNLIRVFSINSLAKTQLNLETSQAGRPRQGMAMQEKTFQSQIDRGELLTGAEGPKLSEVQGPV